MTMFQRTAHKICSLFFDRHPKELRKTPTKPKTENSHKNPIFKAKEKNTKKKRHVQLNKTIK